MEIKNKAGCFEALACSLLGVPAPQLKSFPCLKTVSLRFIAYHAVSRVRLDLGTIWLSQPGALLLVASWHQSGNIGARS